MTASHHIVVMGVSSCGKSTVGELIALKLGLPFKDGDTLHSEENIAKMSSGVPLTDEDRYPWLHRIGEWLEEQDTGGVIACSALKRDYRDRIRAAAPGTVFLHLHGSHDLMAKRMAARPGHFMPTSLLDSQFATLEPLDADEAGQVFDVADKPTVIADEAVACLESLGAGGTHSA